MFKRRFGRMGSKRLRRARQLRTARIDAFRGDRVRIKRQITMCSPLLFANNTGNMYWSSFSETFNIAKTDMKLDEYIKQYDNYKINWVKVSYRWNPQPQNITDAYSYTNQQDPPPLLNSPELYLMTDSDDSRTPSYAEFVARNTRHIKHVILKCGRTYSIFIRPVVNVPVYKTSVSTGYMQVKSPWLDTNDANVPHYALKGLFTMLMKNVQAGPTVITAGSLTYTYTYNVTFRKKSAAMLLGSGNITAVPDDKGGDTNALSGEQPHDEDGAPAP